MLVNTVNIVIFLFRLCAILRPAFAKTICSRKQYTIANTDFYQRIEVESPVSCVERCIENVDYCKAVIFLEEREKPKRNFCQLYGVNSESKSVKIQPEANLDPASTVYEILDKCSSGLASDEQASKELFKKLKPGLRRKVEELPSLDLDENYKGKQAEEVTLTINDDLNQPVIYETARSGSRFSGAVSGESFSSRARPENPFTSTRTRDFGEVYRERPEPKPVPIQPVAIYQNGRLIQEGPSFERGRCPDGFCPSQYRSNIMHRDYPCPARRIGDPCLPRLRCGPPPLPRCELPRLELTKVEVEAPKIQNYWSTWSLGSCSVTCGIGIRRRTRVCSSSEKNACPGESNREEPCELPPCDVWSEWTEWTPCSASCGGGQKSRQRFCRNGQNCVGPTEEYRSCANQPCPSWSPWSPWQCSVTCGQGLARRMRSCQPPDGECIGRDMETQPCENNPCSEWSIWSRWSECSKSCGGGERSRHRECMNGDDCPGPREEHILCNVMECPKWTEWSSWSGCSATCGDEGTRLRNRQCLFEGFPSNECDGPAQDQSACQLEPCPMWSTWSQWSVCSASCGHGQQLRTRECEPRGFGCTGGDREIRFCQLAVCPYWSEWSEWGGCSVTCGIGFCERKRKYELLGDDKFRCERDAPLPGAVLPSEDELGLLDGIREPLKDDIASNRDRPRSNEKAIVKSNQHSNMSSTSSKNVGKPLARDMPKLQEQRLEVAQSGPDIDRSFSRPLQASARGQELSTTVRLDCVGPDVERKQCDAGPCCGWTQWARWSSCNAACGTGSRVRTRICSSGSEYRSSFSEDFERSHFTSSIGQSSFSSVRPISPLVSNGWRRPQRQAGFRQRNRETYIVPQIALPSSPMVDSRCDCEGQSVETEVCEATECAMPAEPLESCTWSAWGKWCGCAGNCQTGIQARTRYCVQEETYDSRRNRARLNSCECFGEKVQTQECTPRHCTSKREQNFEEEEELDDEPVPKSDQEASKELEDDPQSCYWSNWSSWSKCGPDFLKQRTRFCVGLKALINNCECKGAAMEQTSCTPERDGHNFKPFSPAVLDVSRDILQARLAHRHHGSTEAQRDEASSNHENLFAVKTVKKIEDGPCEWQEWSDWSECNANCGEEGERNRTRSCPCRSCQGGITKEIETCNGPSCPENHRVLFD